MVTPIMVFAITTLSHSFVHDNLLQCKEINWLFVPIQKDIMFCVDKLLGFFDSVVDSAVIVKIVCPGTLYDGQIYHETCPLVETSQTKTWMEAHVRASPFLSEKVSPKKLLFLIATKLN